MSLIGKVNLFFLAMSFAMAVGLVISFFLNFLSLNLTYLFVTVSATVLIISFGVVRVNLWWYHRMENSPSLRSIYLVVLGVGAIAAVMGIFQATGLNDSLPIMIVSFTCGVVAVAFIARWRRSSRGRHGFD